MNLSPLEQVNIAADNKQKPVDPVALKKAAMQFEAVLLMKLTSALNANSDDEDSLFGGDAGASMAKQMFSEQLATVMAEAGGVGLAKNIVENVTKKKGGSAIIENLSKSMAAVNEIRKDSAKSAREMSRIKPANDNFTGDPNQVEVISTFEDQVKAEGLDDSLRNLMLDGKIQNSTRARIVPNSAVNELDAVTPAANASKSRSSENLEYKMPVSGRISSNFGTRFHPVDKKTKFHGGMDIAVPTGTSVGAAAEGVVKFAGWKGGYGNYVVIEHPDGKETCYGHLNKINVSVGEGVSAGQPIAASGSTGKSTGPHLHFEVRQNGEVLDPRKVLSNVLR